MWIYSGEVCEGETGIKTELKCDRGDYLYTGDIVILTAPDQCVHTNLTVIVSDKDGLFAMGIKNICLSDPSKLEGWSISKVKDHYEVVDGEHWKAYGFNFSKEQIGQGQSRRESELSSSSDLGLLVNSSRNSSISLDRD